MDEQSTTQIDSELSQEIVTEEPKQEAKQENSYNELPDWARRRMGELAAEKNAADAVALHVHNHSHNVVWKFHQFFSHYLFKTKHPACFSTPAG